MALDAGHLEADEGGTEGRAAEGQALVVAQLSTHDRCNTSSIQVVFMSCLVLIVTVSRIDFMHYLPFLTTARRGFLNSDGQYKTDKCPNRIE